MAAMFETSIAGNCDDNELDFIITHCNVNGGMLNIKQAGLRPIPWSSTRESVKRKGQQSDK